jgi:hypothetical protein
LTAACRVEVDPNQDRDAQMRKPATALGLICPSEAHLLPMELP